MQWRKYNTACLYFSRALEASAALPTDGSVKLQVHLALTQALGTVSQFSLDMKLEVLYNLGLVLLHTNKSGPAFNVGGLTARARPLINSCSAFGMLSSCFIVVRGYGCG